MTEKERMQARIRQRRYQRKKRLNPNWKRRDAKRQAKRRAKIDPNVLREYQRERRFRFLKETKYGHSLKEAGLSIVSETEIKGGVFFFVLKGIKRRESIHDPLFKEKQ